MKTRFLFPRQFKLVGWLLLLPGLAALLLLCINESGIDTFLRTKVFAIFNNYLLSAPETFAVIENGLSDEITVIFIIVGGLLVGFSRERNEDEFISKIRYESLVWAMYVNFAVMIFATIFIYGLYYLDVIMANMFTLLFFFIIRFHIMLYKLNKSMADEE